MAIKSVGQEHSSFFVEESVDPTTYGGTFLSYNPETNTYEQVGYQEMLERTEVPDAATGRTETIGDFFKRSEGRGGRSPTPSPSIQEDLPGSIHRAAAGFSAFNTVADVMQTASMTSPFGLAMTAYEGWTGLEEGMGRAATFEAAAEPTASIPEKLAAFGQKPGLFDIAKDVAITGLSAFTGNLLGAASGALGVASGISGRIEAEEALQAAGAMERQAAVTGAPTFGGFGYVNTVADFMAQQEVNMQAAATQTTQLASIDPVGQTLSDVMGGWSGSTSFSSSRDGGFDTTTTFRDSSSGDVYSRTDFSGGGSFSQNISENQRTAERRSEEGYTGSTSSDRRGTSEGATGSASDRDTPSTSGYEGAYGF